MTPVERRVLSEETGRRGQGLLWRRKCLMEGSMRPSLSRLLVTLGIVLALASCGGKDRAGEVPAEDTGDVAAGDSAVKDIRSGSDTEVSSSEACPQAPEDSCLFPDCDDELECTADSLQAGTCNHDLLPGYCLFEWTCFASGDANPENPCQVCDPDATHLTWTELQDGSPCGEGMVCKSGSCKCQPDCAGKECGDDGCGGTCGECSEEQECKGGVCKWTEIWSCVGHCNDKPGDEEAPPGLACYCDHSCPVAGDCCNDWCEACPGMPWACDACPGLPPCCYSDADCDDGDMCVEGECFPCQPDCAGKQCGDDGCGGSCGECEGPKMQCVEGECQVVCDCLSDADCTPAGVLDLCNGMLVCGLTTPCMCEFDPESVVNCPVGQVCIPSTGECCTPDCDGKECGDDGCGGSCGACAEGLVCNGLGQCNALLPGGCCEDDSDCPEPDAGPTYLCVGKGAGELDFGVCKPEHDPARCWDDGDCGPSFKCHGASVCGCQGECDPEFDEEGICLSPDGKCALLKEDWVDEVCDAASIVIFDGDKCMETCAGCCACSVGDCQQYHFESVADCEVACAPWLAQCPKYVAALAEWAYWWDTVVECPTVSSLWRCQTDEECQSMVMDCCQFGMLCVQGNCVDCWSDETLPFPDPDASCRAGHSVEPPPVWVVGPPCNMPGCSLLYLSEVPRPVCVCDSVFDKPCNVDADCLVYDYPYKRCVYGRCAECRGDEDCDGMTCLPPGLCFSMDPHPSVIYGTWLIGTIMDSIPAPYRFIRFEPDGILRRGQYESLGGFMDDGPGPVCTIPMPLDGATIGTWEPDTTQNGSLAIRMQLLSSCAPGEVWTARYLVTVSEDGEYMLLQDLETPFFGFDGARVSPDSCLPDMSLCDISWMSWGYGETP